MSNAESVVSRKTDDDKDGNSNTSDDEHLDKTIVEKAEKAKSKKQERRSHLQKRSTKSKGLTGTQIDSMKVADLKKKLEEFNLSSNGKKQELRDRLKNFQLDKNNEEEDEADSNTDENTDEDTDEEEDEEEDEDDDDDDYDDMVSEIRRKQRAHRAAAKEKKIDSRRTRIKRETMDEMRHRTTDSFAIRDAEGSLNYFSGDDGLTIQRWIAEFEDVSMLLEWNDLQKLIYAKRMLRGSARQFVTFEGCITSWKTLKRCLLREFQEDTNSATIHAELYRRKRQANETSRQYVYAMLEIASKGHIEEDALIQHIVDGIPDDDANKMVLYRSVDLAELKKNLKTYDRLKQRFDKKKMYSKKDTTTKESKSGFRHGNKKTHCFGCGSPNHEIKDCLNKQKGPKCFKCNDFGHIATNCQNSKELGSGTGKVSCVKSRSDDVCVVQINDVTCQALIDTGSDVNLIQKDIYERIGSPSLSETTRVFTGFGNAQTVPLGRFTTKAQVGNNCCKIVIFVVPTNVMSSEMILGKDFLKDTDVRINKGKIEIKKVYVENADVEDSKVNKTVNLNREEIDNAEDQPGNSEIIDLAEINYVEANELDITGPYLEKVQKLVNEYNPVKNVTTTIETKIVLSDENPVRLRPRRLAPKEKRILNEQIEEWMNEGIISKSKSEYASPVVIVPKKDNSYRVCIDFRELNKKIVRDRFPMPLIEDCIDSLSGAQIFSVVDLKNGFFHVPVAENSRKYTSFVTPDGQYEFRKTPFGLSNSPTSFLRFVDDIFRDLTKSGIVVTYMDDVIIPGVDVENAFENLVKTIHVAESHGLQINWKKCKFLQPRVEFLGHVIENGRVGPSPAKVKAIKNFPEPIKKKDVQSFLGLTGYFRKFVKNYAKIAHPLSDLLKDGIKFNFLQDQKRAFVTLKAALSGEPVLRIYRPQAKTELHTDASCEGYGAVLLQKDDNEKAFHPVYYMSRKTSDAERKYTSYELELLAIIKAVQKFRVYLLGLDFKIITDCEAVQKTLYKKDLSPRVARWALALEEFNYTIEHRPGDKLKHVDALSRYPVLIIEDKMREIIRKRQDEEERLRVIKQVLAKQPYEDYVVENDLLMKECDGKNVIVLPVSMHVDTIRRVHENGHFGVKKVAERIKQEFYIPNLNDRIESVISCCVPCILAERKRGKKEGFLQPIPKGDAPLCTYHLDHLGPMTATGKSYKYIFVVVDAFAKFVWIYPTKTTNASEVLSKLSMQQKTFGNPKRIVSDKGAAFTSKEFRAYCTSENIEHLTITTGIPRGNGQVERINRIIIPVLTKLSVDRPCQWYKHVSKLQRCLNSTFQRSVGMTPFEVLFGAKMRQREDPHILSLVEEEAVEIFDGERDKLRVIAKGNLLKIQEENRRNHNKTCQEAKQYNDSAK